MTDFPLIDQVKCSTIASPGCMFICVKPQSTVSQVVVIDRLSIVDPVYIVAKVLTLCICVCVCNQKIFSLEPQLPVFILPKLSKKIDITIESIDLSQILSRR